MTQFDDLPRLRQPEYTGENRCLPCTVVNLLLAGLGGAALGLVTHPAVGVLGFGASALVVYLRGYLVPGTPTLTRRYFPPWLLRAFGKESLRDRQLARDGQAPAAEADDPLVAAGVVARKNGDRDVTPAFREAWHARIEQLGEAGVETGMVAETFGADAAERHGPATFVVDGEASVRWGSEAACLADVAAGDLLSDRLDAWPDYGRDTRRSLLMGLRLCLATCPGCGGSVRVDEDRVDPCCEKPHLVAEAVCTDCGAALADAAVVDSGTETTVRASYLNSG